MYTYIARQPIFDQHEQVVGYELLYRDGKGGNAATIRNGDWATRGVLADALTVFGIPDLTGGLPAYINFTRKLLLNDFAFLADPQEIVVEIMNDVQVDGQLVDKLRQLRRAGYTLALEDYGYSTKYDRITELFDIIRIDMGKYNRLQCQQIIKRLSWSKAKLLAECLETEEEFFAAQKMGFKLFQGYYFEKPTKLVKETPALCEISYGKLLNELLKPTTDFKKCREIVESDVILTYLLLRYMKKINYYKGDPVSEIQQGLMMMGTSGLRRWVCLVMMLQENTARSDELPRRAYRRGRFIESLMEESNENVDSDQGFLLGVFSLLDRIFAVPMEQLLRDMRLGPDIKCVLLGQGENRYTKYLKYSILYEMKNGRGFLPKLNLTLDDWEVADMYRRCAAETHYAFSQMGANNG